MPIKTMKKICRKCLQEKDINIFPENFRYRDGHSSYCNPCKNIMEAHRRREVLSRKPLCRFKGCDKKVALYKSFYCSDAHAAKDLDMRSWQKQKADPNYKEYHRKIAREWARKHSARGGEL